ncbi:hypothetical protein HUK80_17490 [Flavobacterium sp. MAH-1]|uniref:PA14 domain-containing protein n=1 Tax=Flavobacterium agri TaxID=2743471 RepID=A0A7Y9C8T1_9FLAO|nr:hypothetical protein [Flavobacterium agri]NUY82700.1 hypothetical protein [Flavobacterium agri]NYA72723.1 hypothetical protein [Flavobacterium agri]
MISKIRTSRFSKFLAFYLTVVLVVETLRPTAAYALTSGPSQPEFKSFTPLETSDMVDLSSGNFNYNIPIMDVGGYPINLAYDGNITMDKEASWTGLGWNLNVGQIDRQVNGLPDDFRGDEMKYENDIRTNSTIGTNYTIHPAIFGANFPVDIGIGIGVQYNNYEGISFKPTMGISYELNKNVSVGVEINSGVGDGASVTPKVTLDGKLGTYKKLNTYMDGTLSGTYSSRKGFENLSMQANVRKTETKNLTLPDLNGGTFDVNYEQKEQKHSSSHVLNFNTINYTPSKRVAYNNSNFTFNASIGAEVFGAEFQGRILGYGSFQSIDSDYKNRRVKAYGYENTQYKTGEGILDFNRENEQDVNKNTSVLPITNYTYDVYSIQAQNISGMFRPYRSQVAHVYNDDVTDNGIGATLGLEFGAGELVHGGISIDVSGSTSTTGRWNTDNNAKPYFVEKSTDKNTQFYEPITYKVAGEIDADPDGIQLDAQYHSSKPVRLKLDKSKWNNKTEGIFQVKNSNGTNGPSTYSNENITGPIKRTQRMNRGKMIQKVSVADAKYDPFIVQSWKDYVKPHHTAGMRVLQPGGGTYVFGQAVYNTKKVEATFDVSKKSAGGKYNSGLLGGITGTEGSNSQFSDKYLNRVTTPPYAHSYLLTSVLSTDYEDVTGNGPSVDDLGAFTKFEYETKSDNYKWRAPYEQNMVSFNEGFKSHNDDEKGSYLYGEKELVYLKRIITKSHVALFSLSPRKDGLGAKGELGGSSSTPEKLWRLDKITLYAYNEAKKANLLDDNAANDLPCTPLKTAFFEYNYELCKGTPNHEDYQANDFTKAGKLTLKKVYFTYRDSNMGKYTPYVFDYGAENADSNPNYNLGGSDIWGNYKPNLAQDHFTLAGPMNNSEFPYVQQNDTTATQNAQAWVLKSIQLPSGGKVNIESESDDYAHVQDKRAVQMFKVSGAGQSSSPSSIDDVTQTNLYTGNSHKKYLYVNLGPNLHGFTPGGEDVDDAWFRSHYLRDHKDKPVYFKFLLNMVGDTNTQYDYVTGYFEVDSEGESSKVNIVGIGTNFYAAIPLKKLDRDGGVNSDANVNPIAKAGWQFGRAYLNKIVYSIGGESSNDDFESIVQDLVGSIEEVSQLWNGPNKALQSKGCAKTFVADKSWIRLENPFGHKYGGGIRVKSVKLSDNWDVMTGDSQVEGQEYGQVYDYDDPVSGESSGVATYEPNASPENPLVMPFYSKAGKYADKLAAPRDRNYVEKPIGANYFPAPKVTYSKVTVKSIPRKQNGFTVAKHATGKTVTEFYTTKDFPTISDYTDISLANDPTPPLLGFILNIASINHLVATQGFAIDTNDMDGKMKSQMHYAEGQDTPQSGTTYKYSVDAQGKLNNMLPVIDEKGNVSQKVLGVQNDMINDFNESKSQSASAGIDFNLAAMIFGIIPAIIPTGFPRVSYHETILRTAVTTKVTTRVGILAETTSFDGNSTVTTKNLAWDASTGRPILTEVNNEYNDKYYKLDFPAYWNYDNMGLASRNIDVTGFLQHEGQLENNGQSGHFTWSHTQNPFSAPYGEIEDVLKLGDELILPIEISVGIPEVVLGGGTVNPTPPFTRAWVAGYKKVTLEIYGEIRENILGVFLVDSRGMLVDPCYTAGDIPFRIIRSGRRNLETLDMASITCLKNPINTTTNRIDFEGLAYSSGSGKQVINASAVEYNDYWRNSWQRNGLVGQYPGPGEGTDDNGNLSSSRTYSVNPYLGNIKGDWHAVRSYAYLTGRNSAGGDKVNPRISGFFTSFDPYYTLDEDDKWQINPQQDHLWTYVSSVTKYDAYGGEIENKDALDRYSSAQYGYDNTLPVAVASNSRYQQMGAENFEETAGNRHFGFSFGEALEVNEEVGISTNRAHSGKKSMRVPAGEKAQLARKIKELETAGRDLFNCSTESQPVSRPKCVAPFKQNFDIVNGDYMFQIPINFGLDGPNGAVNEGAVALTCFEVCEGSAGYSVVNYNSSTKSAILRYQSFSRPHSSYFRLIDSNGDCMLADIVILPPALGAPENSFEVQVHGCQDSCECP